MRRRERQFWEGRQAYSDLAKTGQLERVRLEEEGDVVECHVMPQICRTLEAYSRNLNGVRNLINSQRYLEDWLEQQARQFRKKSRSVNDRDCARDLTRIAKKIDEIKRGTRIDLPENWRNPLGFALPFRGHRVPLQERELDSWFQVHLGVVLRTFMQGDPFERSKRRVRPSLRTIARLIVLFLVCADLAEIREGRVRLRHNGRRVTVSGVFGSESKLPRLEEIVRSLLGKKIRQFFGLATKMVAITQGTTSSPAVISREKSAHDGVRLATASHS